MDKLKKAAALSLLTTLVTQNFVWADDAPRLSNPREGEANLTQGAEYRAGQYPGAVLMPVQVWGAVGKPGSYELPIKTDLATFLTYAGGPSKEAEMDSLTIRRSSRGKTEILKIDLDSLFANPKVTPPTLEPNDVVYLPPHKAFIDPDVAQTITVFGAILGIVLSSLVLSNQLKK